MRMIMVAGLGVMLLAGCAPRDPGWVGADGTVGRAAADLSACRRWADDRLDPDRSAETRLATPLAADDRARMRRQIDMLVSACMQERGYRPAQRR